MTEPDEITVAMTAVTAGKMPFALANARVVEAEELFKKLSAEEQADLAQILGYDFGALSPE